MNVVRPALLVSALTMFASSGWSADQPDRSAHHADASSSAMNAAPAAADAATKQAMSKIDAQMKAMHTMHEKMMRAKTPEARSALMAEHMNVMHKGMAMMSDISKPGMAGAGAMQMPMQEGMSDMAAHHQMMEKRMAMMTSMMQMMMDRLPEPSAK